MVDLVPVKHQCLAELAISHLQSLKPCEDLLRMCLTSAALLVIDRSSPLHNYVPLVNEALFGLSFRRLRVLRISGDYRRTPTLDVLHCFQCLEELSLDYVSALPHHKPLPLARTLKKLLKGSKDAKLLASH